MDKELTEIIVIVDRSGSMASVKQEAISGFNDFLKKQQEAKIGRCLLTYCQFNTAYEIVHNGVPVEDVPPLTEKTYVPSGMTALHDAVGRTLDAVGERLAKTPEEKRPCDVTVVILTDGLENSSSEYGLSQVQEKVKHQTEKYNWSFVFLGQNINAFHAGRMLGLDAALPQHYVGQMVQGAVGQNRGFGVMGDMMVRKRACSAGAGGMSVGFSAADKQAYTSALSGEGAGATSTGNVLINGTGETDSSDVLAGGTGDAD